MSPGGRLLGRGREAAEEAWLRDHNSNVIQFNLFIYGVNVTHLLVKNLSYVSN